LGKIQQHLVSKWQNWNIVVLFPNFAGHALVLLRLTSTANEKQGKVFISGYYSQLFFLKILPFKLQTVNF